MSASTAPTFQTDPVRSAKADRTREPGAEVAVSIAPPAPTHVRRGEILRKLLHISPGFLAFLLPLTAHDKPLTGEALIELTLITAALTGVYIALRRFVARPGESDFYTTTLSYPAAVLGTLFAFPGAPELAAVVVVVIAFGDGSAYLGGKQFGRTSLPWNSHKTWAGTFCFVTVAGPLAAIAYRGEAGLDSSWSAAIVCGGGAALLAAIAESLPTRISDNLRVGITAAVTVAALHYGPVMHWL